METSSSNSAPNLSRETVKLFVGRINESLKEEEIRDHFAKFGEVKEVVVVKDKATGNVRGFGFVEFLDPASAERALTEREHAIGDRVVDVKRARPRCEQRRNHQSPHYHYSIHSDQDGRGLSSNVTNNYNDNPLKLKKIFVGGLSSSITEDEFRSYFQQFGKITDVVIMYDSSTHRPRGFGFITFDSVEAVDSVLQRKYHQLNNKTVEVKIAVPKDSNSQNNFGESNGNMGGGRGPSPSSHQRGYYPPYSPRYGLFPGYAPPLVPGFYYGTPGYGGGYGVGPYSGFGYGASLVNPRSPYNNSGMMGPRRSPSYGNAFMYPGYGYGYSGVAPTGGYRGYLWAGNDKLNQTDSDIRLTDSTTGADDLANEKLEIQQTS